MKKLTIAILILSLAGIILLAWVSLPRPIAITRAQGHSRIPGDRQEFGATNPTLKNKAGEALLFCRTRNFCSDYCFLVDMSLPSGSERFFVYDLKKGIVKNSGLVTHGRCNQDWLEGRKYGNTPGCGCTSLGKYKIGQKYSGRFGTAFKLYGLDQSNDQAFARFVVLHAHSCVPEKPTPDEICQSDGCPTVSPAFLNQLSILINQSKKPVLLWVYE